MKSHEFPKRHGLEEWRDVIGADRTIGLPTSCRCSAACTPRGKPHGEIDDNVSLLPPAPTLHRINEGATENDPASAEANDLSAETKILTKVIKALRARFASAFEAIVHATSDSTVENAPMASSQEQVQRPAAMHSEDPALTDPTSSISRGVTVVGKIFGEGTVQLFGRIEGEVRAFTVLIKEGAQVEGAVVAEELTIAGQVKGTIHANRVKLDNTAVVEGDIFHRLLSIEENARFEGLSKREDNAGDMLRSRLGRSSPQDDRQTNVTPIDAIDRAQRAVDVVAALGGGSRDLAPGALRDNSGRRAPSSSPSLSSDVVPCDTAPSR